MGSCFSYGRIPAVVSSVRAVTGTSTTLESATYEGCSIYTPIDEDSDAKIVKVIDGDTVYIAVMHNDKLVRLSARLRNIDTPELRSADLSQKLLAQEAKDKLTEKAYGKMVKVKDVGLDKYGRVLCNLYVIGESQSLSEYMLTFPTLCKIYDGGAK